MAWRTITRQGREWAVTAAAERRSTTADWQLIFGFRPTGAERGVRTLWAIHSFTALDKASLLRQADLVNDEELATLLGGVATTEGG